MAKKEEKEKNEENNAENKEKRQHMGCAILWDLAGRKLIGLNPCHRFRLCEIYRASLYLIVVFFFSYKKNDLLSLHVNTGHSLFRYKSWNVVILVPDPNFKTSETILVPVITSPKSPFSIKMAQPFSTVNDTNGY